jgi:hypothetical protein
MRHRNTSKWRFTAIAVLLLLAGVAQASLGDRLPEFKECVEVHRTPYRYKGQQLTGLSDV